MAENSNTKRKKTTKKEKATTTTKTKKKATKRTTVAGNWKLKKPMSNEDLKKFLSGVVRGEIKDFAGLDPSLDVRIKAAKELMTINTNEEAMDHVPETKVTVVIEDTTSTELKNLDKDLHDNEYEN